MKHAKNTLGQKWHEESQALGAVEGAVVGLAVAVCLIIFITAGAAKHSYDVANAQVVEGETIVEASDISIAEVVVEPPMLGLHINEGWEKTFEPEPEPTVEEYYYEEPVYYYDGSYSGGYSGDGFMQQGVRDFNGRTETWYSSNSLYHYRTGEWSVDDEGYYRTDDGYYVVAVSENEYNSEAGRNYQEGDIIQTSKGEGMVLDSGCDVGTTDFYVNF